MTTLALQTRIDDFSYQVYTSADDRFWFRLVRERDRDVITDFFLGSFPAGQGGPILIECYRKLELHPQRTVVFADVLSGAKPDPAAVASARERHASEGSALLAAFGLQSCETYIENARGKVNVILAVTDG